MYLGIDLGTSELKLLLLDEHHHVLATAAQPLALQRPQALWSEQHPDDWWAALDRAMQALQTQQPLPMRAVRAIGLAGQMHGAVLLDAHQHVLRAAMLWNDGRSAAQCAQLEAALPALHRVAGNLAMPGFTAPKLLWVRQNEPHIFARTALVLLPKDWLRLRLTGDAVSDMSDASGSLWLDVRARDWWDEGLAACGLSRRHMPRLVEGQAPCGFLLPALAARWGLSRTVVVAGGAGDNAASAVGVGAVRPMQGFVSLGTSGVIFLSTAEFKPKPEQAVHAFCHALAGRWHQMSVMLSAASALRWARLLLGQPSEAALLAQVATLSAAKKAKAPVFLPYLSGERTPHNDPQAPALLHGLRHEHGAADVAYAVIEGVAFGLADGWASLGAAPGAVSQLPVVGGGARSALWLQLIASTLGLSLTTCESSQAGAALGAARLAWLADGGNEDEVCQAETPSLCLDPDARQAQQLAPRLAQFRALYPALRGVGLHG